MKSLQRLLPLAAAILLLVAVLSGCGGDGDLKPVGEPEPGTEIGVEEVSPTAEQVGSPESVVNHEAAE